MMIYALKFLKYYDNSMLSIAHSLAQSLMLTSLIKHTFQEYTTIFGLIIKGSFICLF